MSDGVPTTPSYPGEALPLTNSPSGINVIPFEKYSGKEGAIVRAHNDWTNAVDGIQAVEQLFRGRRARVFPKS